MKRTQERWNNPHPDSTERFGVSGLKEFDGEDLSKTTLNQNTMHEINISKTNRRNGSTNRSGKRRLRIRERTMKNSSTLPKHLRLLE
jgi:hypothetical protein